MKARARFSSSVEPEWFGRKAIVFERTQRGTDPGSSYPAGQAGGRRAALTSSAVLQRWKKMRRIIGGVSPLSWTAVYLIRCTTIDLATASFGRNVVVGTDVSESSRILTG